MKFAQQRQLPLSFVQHSSAAAAASSVRTVRWQVGSSGQAVAPRDIIQVAGHVRPARARGVVAPQKTAVVAVHAGPGYLPIPPSGKVDPQCAGRSFGRARLLHAIELFGSCMMIAAFLVLALFG